MQGVAGRLLGGARDGVSADRASAGHAPCGSACGRSRSGRDSFIDGGGPSSSNAADAGAVTANTTGVRGAALCATLPLVLLALAPPLILGAYSAARGITLAPGVCEAAAAVVPTTVMLLVLGAAIAVAGIAVAVGFRAVSAGPSVLQVLGARASPFRRVCWPRPVPSAAETCLPSPSSDDAAGIAPRPLPTSAAKAAAAAATEPPLSPFLWPLSLELARIANTDAAPSPGPSPAGPVSMSAAAPPSAAASSDAAAARRRWAAPLDFCFPPAVVAEAATSASVPYPQAQMPLDGCGSTTLVPPLPSPRSPASVLFSAAASQSLSPSTCLSYRLDDMVSTGPTSPSPSPPASRAAAGPAASPLSMPSATGRADAEPPPSMGDTAGSLRLRGGSAASPHAGGHSVLYRSPVRRCTISLNVNTQQESACLSG
ncbi:hypothetical protein GPECTOR_18g98 [Gonium pectorale]|uniref:Uncharacterized protein n=1 Tax=Gonium pectorale TaxID=33097 RepID=A0A150GK24_GONPE|nr:hypothetical protein GPECTOR_18g98 [Gonium pectorale]|eukprot:KXZ50124.1 hypothetical protein GPECTOR_18g98 [Gonium pectorale]